MKNTSITEVSEVIDTICDREKGKGCLGFMIIYQDGRIMNRVIDYDRDSFTSVNRVIHKLHDQALRKYHLGGKS